MKTLVAVGLALAAAGAPAAAFAQGAGGSVVVQGNVQVGAPVQTALPPPPPAPAPVQVQYVAPPPRVVYVYANAPGGQRSRPLPYRGGPVPAGMRVEERPATALIVTGAVTFGAGYVGGVLYSGIYAHQPGSAWGFVPIVGPFVFAAMVASAPRGSSTGYPYDPTSGIVMPLVVQGIAQVLGGVLFTVGLATRFQVLVPNATAAGPAPRRRAQWSVSPGAAGAEIGASFSLLHF